jgi:hypothetical protein
MTRSRDRTGIGNERTKPLYEPFTPKEHRPSNNIPATFTKPGSGGQERRDAIINGSGRVLSRDYGGKDGLKEYMETDAFNANARALEMKPEELANILLERIAEAEEQIGESDIAKPPLA